MKPQVSIYHDTRREKKSGLFPVKIRVWDPYTKRAKLYPTKFDLSIKDFYGSWETKRPREVYKELRKKLNYLLTKSEKIADKIDPFNFNSFEKRFSQKPGDNINIYSHYDNRIRDFQEQNQYNTSFTYEAALKSIKSFLKDTKGRGPNKILFHEITPEFLSRYENYMVSEGKSYTTISIYLRTLRTLFNSAIAEGNVKPEFYPFGKRKYQVPAIKSVKKSLDQEQLKKLFRGNPQSPEQEKAKDFWFFSYAANGMNIKDIALLKYKNIQEDRIVFYRAKVQRTSKTNLKPIKIYLNDFLRLIIEKHGSNPKDPNSYIFNIIDPNVDPKTQQFQIKKFTRFVNQHIKKYAESIGLSKDISSYWARHSFTTNAIRNGATLEFVQESLGHSNIKTTMNYWAGFDDSTKKEFAERIMDF